MSHTESRIFIVEDQRLIAADLESTLRKIGYQVVGNVGSGEEAVAEVASQRPDLVLMDIRLRGAMDGIQAAAVLRERFDIPVVYLTAYVDEETISRAKLTSPFGYVVKPFNERELRATIEIALYRHTTDRLLAEEKERRRTAEKRAAERAQLLAVFRNAPAAIAIFQGPTHVYELSNPVYNQLLGKDPSGLPAAEAGPQVLENGIPTILDRVYSARRPEIGSEVQMMLQAPDGARREIFVNYVYQPMLGPDGAPEGIIAFLFDITAQVLARRSLEEAAAERERLVHELKDAIRARDEFLQVASHELRTPLTPLQLHLDMVARAVEKNVLENQRLASRLETAGRQTTRLTALVESLLDFARITGGRLALDLEEIDLCKVVRDVGQRFQAEAHAAGSEISLCTCDAIRGDFDRQRVEQVVSNLLSNAIKYGKGGLIEVDVRGEDGMARLAVTDHGMGIEEGDLARIFDRFERAVSMRHFGGLGLGLYIARQIAEAHGGTIVAQSQPGLGSTFTVLLPVVPGSPRGVDVLEDRS